ARTSAPQTGSRHQEAADSDRVPAASRRRERASRPAGRVNSLMTVELYCTGSRPPPSAKLLSMAKIRVAVFPAAGLGTRFLPATKAQPKEMLPLVDRPLVQYVVEEARDAGIDRIVIVTGRGKNAIEDHFDTSFELERMLEDRGKNGLLEQVREVSEL